MSGLEIEISGEGYVESQSVSKGAIITDSSPIVVNLKTPEQIYLSPKDDETLEEEDLPQD
ncbi:Penicillin-binding protein 2B OS=Ureibacillus acetophenoni OX=614649 GN=SAMN05877842_101375 PE=3 SV=1 [Ureibacillus acetophenoni]